MLVERALEAIGVRFGFMENYVSSEFPLIKLHGSIDWVRSVIVEGRRHSELQPYQLIEYAELLRPLGEIHKEGADPQIHTEERLFAIPALAIPVVTKSDFVCPTSHLNHLSALIPSVTKILTIGWRGAEQHFLKMLSENLKTEVSVMVVCGTEEAGAETSERLRSAGVHGGFRVFPGGFSDFILGQDWQTFLRA